MKYILTDSNNYKTNNRNNKNNNIITNKMINNYFTNGEVLTFMEKKNRKLCDPFQKMKITPNFVKKKKKK